MNKTAYFTLWGGLFILCAGLGFIPEPEGLLKFLLIAMSIAFFIPPAMLLRNADRKQDTVTIRLIRDLSIWSLVLTMVILIANFMSLMAPEAVGNILYVILVIVSTPMFCSQYWVLGLFLWACVLMCSLSLLKKKKKA